MVSQLLKLLLISLPALATSQAPGHVSVSFSTASSSSEAHSDSTKVSFSTALPVNGTVTPQAGGGNSTHPATPSPKKTGARKLAGYYPVYNYKGQSVSELRYGQCSVVIFTTPPSVITHMSICIFIHSFIHSSGVDLYDEIIFFVASTTENFTISTSPFEPNEWDSLALDFVKNCKNSKHNTSLHTPFEMTAVLKKGPNIYFL
jgi:hypothetical protein